MRFAWVCLIAAAALGGGFLLWPRPVLEVRGVRAERVAFRAPASTGDEFRLRYTHSVERMPVEAVFRVETGEDLRLVATRFTSHGPGLPATGLTREGEEFVSSAAARMGSFRFYVSPINEAELSIGGRTLSLPLLLPEGEIAEIAVRRRGRLFLWLDALQVFGPAEKRSTR